MAPSSRLHLLCWTLVALAFMLVKPATAQDCSVARYGLTLGHDSTEYMTVRRGGACTQVVTAPGVGGFTEREATLSGISLISRARHGNAGVAGRSTYAYKARPGYVGPDQFVVLARGPAAPRASSYKSTWCLDAEFFERQTSPWDRS